MSRGLRAALVALGAAGGFAAPPAAAAAERSATPSTLSSVFAGAGGGDVIRLSSGSYGTFRGASKPSTVTLKAADGASVTMGLSLNGVDNLRFEGLTVSGAEISGSASNITIRGSRFTGHVLIRADQLANAGIVLDDNDHRDINVCGTCYEGRITVIRDSGSPSGVVISNSRFSGGNTDGLQIGGRGVRVLGNEFSNLRQGDPSVAHTDAVQLYGQSETVLRGNYFHDVVNGIVAWDGATREVIEDNVIMTTGGQPAVALESDNGSVVRHNTMVRSGLRLFNKSGNAPGTGTRVLDNIIPSFNRESGSLAEENFNLIAGGGGSGPRDLRGVPIFVGGSSPAGVAGFALAPGSPGKAAASDGTDIGARIGGALPAPPPLPVPDPDDGGEPEPVPDVPADAVWSAPQGARTGQPVRLDGTASGGNGPLVCTWSFENEDGGTVWETRSGCSIQMTFRNADTKHVKLTVRDADGDTDALRRSFSVAPGSWSS